jgi:hypothetical protein
MLIVVEILTWTWTWKKNKNLSLTALTKICLIVFPKSHCANSEVSFDDADTDTAQIVDDTVVNVVNVIDTVKTPK